MDLYLQDKIAIVTGGATGIGKSIVEMLAEAGAIVYFTYHTSEAAALKLETELHARNARVQALSCDVRDPENIKHICDEVGRENGRIDILVNNAGVNRDGLVMRLSDSSWQDMLDTNTTPVFQFTKGVLPYMLKNGGSIINIGSIAGLSGNAGQSAYATSKAAIVGFSKSVAREYGSRNIRCNVIAPGYVRTAMTEVLKEEQKMKAADFIPLGRFAEAEEIAPVVAFLASSRSSYITGQVLPVCGGLY